MSDKSINEEVEKLFVELMQKTYKHWEIVVKEFSLTVTQAMALHHLEESQPMRNLADKLACDPSYITGLIDGLEKLNLVERSADKADRRVKNLVLTKEGLKLKKQLITRLAENSPIVAGLSATEKQSLRDTLKALVESG